jgi:hypothetical protein
MQPRLATSRVFGVSALAYLNAVMNPGALDVLHVLSQFWTESMKEFPHGYRI